MQQSNEEKAVTLKSEIAHISLRLKELEADKKAQIGSFKDLIKDVKSELSVRLEELKELNKEL